MYDNAKQAAYTQASAPSTFGYAASPVHSELDHQLDRLGNAVDGTEKLVGALRERLGPVLRSMPESNAIDKSPPEEVLSPCGDAVRSLAKRAARANAQLDYILGALAV